MGSNKAIADGLLVATYCYFSKQSKLSIKIYQIAV